jgi:hypothetical protein
MVFGVINQTDIMLNFLKNNYKKQNYDKINRYAF